MTAIRIDGFSGIAPLIDPRKLAAGGATLARDCRFDGTDLRPLLATSLQSSLGFAVSRLFKYRFQGASTWLAWPTPWEVDPVASPVPQDSLGRLYWSRIDPSTINTPTADNYPRAASQPTQAAITANNPGIIRRLGVPQPTAKPTTVELRASASISTGPPRTLTSMSQTSPVTVTAAGHPFKEGQRVACSRVAAVPTDEGMKEVIGLEFIVGNVTASTFDLRDSDGANYTAFTSSTSMSIKRVYQDADLESRSYVSTFVTDWGEEGMPSPPSDVADFRYDSTVTATVDRLVPAWASAFVNRIRLYRTETGTAGSEFFFVKEVAIAPTGTTQPITDDVKDAALGELLPSEFWAPAPNGLRGLFAMPNGFLGGFNGNTIYFSEPYQPSAWPDSYRKTTQDDIVGIAVYGQTAVLATKGKPYLASGTDPASVSLQQLDIDAPCLNKGGVCSVGAGVVYPTPDGLAFISAASSRVVTLQHVSKRQWAALWSTTMDAVYHDGRYIAFSRDAGKPSLIVELKGDGLNISDTATLGRAPAIDPDDDTLNFILVSGVSQQARHRFDEGPAALTARWTSKVFTLPHAVNLSIGRVFASGYPISLTVRYGNLQAGTGQPDGTLPDSYTINVAGPEPFRLPGGFLSREYQVVLDTAHDVQSLILSDNTDDVREQ